jgi:cytoskeletal protein CcmA (bactofilin family)
MEKGRSMKKERKADSITTFLGADSHLEGSIEFQGTIRVDGKVNGKISSNDGTVIVGEKAFIQADISVAVAVIMGEVDGTIDAKDRIEVYRRSYPLSLGEYLTGIVS